MDLKDGDILVFKGAKWHKLVKGLFSKETRNLYFGRMMIQLFTLSNKVHTATVRKKGDKYYIVQALLHEGVCEQELYMPWLLSELDKNNIDVYRQGVFDAIDFNYRIVQIKDKTYSKLGIIKIGLYNLFGIKFKDSKGYFCSELTAYLHRLTQDNYWLVSPEDVADNGFLEKIM